MTFNPHAVREKQFFFVFSLRVINRRKTVYTKLQHPEPMSQIDIRLRLAFLRDKNFNSFGLKVLLPILRIVCKRNIEVNPEKGDD